MAVGAMECMVGGLPPYTLPIGELQAVVGVVPMTQYSGDWLRNNLQRLDWVERAVRSHERVVEGCLQQADVVPMRFCTIFRSERDLVAAVTERREEVSSKLAELKGRQEWGLHLLADRERLRRHLLDSDPHLLALQDSAGSRPMGAAYFAKKLLQDRTACSMEQAVAETSENAYARLSTVAPRARLLQAKGPALADCTPVLNAAFLVTASELRALLAEAQQIVSERPWLRDRTSGPWPPYNFT